jgi:hypothetical protein
MTLILLAVDEIQSTGMGLDLVGVSRLQQQNMCRSTNAMRFKAKRRGVDGFLLHEARRFAHQIQCFDDDDDSLLRTAISLAFRVSSAGERVPFVGFG